MRKRGEKKMESQQQPEGIAKSFEDATLQLLELLLNLRLGERLAVRTHNGNVSMAHSRLDPLRQNNIIEDIAQDYLDRLQPELQASFGSRVRKVVNDQIHGSGR